MTPERLREIERIFHEARERPAAERGSFLTRACAGDSALRREVESLLAQPPAGLIDAPVGALVAGIVPPPAPRLVQPFPLVGRGRWKISTAGSTEPRWSRDARELFYRTQTGLMRVPVETTDPFKAGLPSLVASGTYFGGSGRSYDTSRDGQRFLMMKTRIDPDDPLAGLTQIVVVQHWFEELKAKLAAVK